MNECISDINKLVTLSSFAQTEVRSVGAEKSKVIVVDNVFEEIKLLNNHTSRFAKFQARKANLYPGSQAQMFGEFGQVFLKYAQSLIETHYPITASLQCKPLAAFYSFVSTSEKELTHRQTIPHYDHNSNNSFAVMLYMAPGDFGGTGFFQQEGTLFETISTSRESEFLQQLDKNTETGDSSFRYCIGSGAGFTLTDSVNYQQNRMLIYPGNLLHSGLIDESRDIHINASKARITANLFITYE